MDDFFSSAGGASDQLAPVASTEELSNFEAAIGKRFGGASPSSLLTTRMATATTTAPLPRIPMSMPASMPLATPASSSALGPRVASGPGRGNKDRPFRSPMSPPSPSHTPSGPLSQLSLSSPSKPLTRPSEIHQHDAHHDRTSVFTPHTPTEIPSILRSSSSSSAPSLFQPSSTSIFGNGSASGSSVLLIDIRNHHHFVTSRIHSSINLSVPSTLLKRPAFGLAKLAEMIPLASDRSAFSRWQRAEHIIVYDADSSTLSAGNNVLGLLRKFRIEGFQDQLGYIIGGFNAVARLQPDCVSNSLLVDPTRSDEAHAPGTLMSHRLPSSAFQQSSTVSIPGTKPTEVAVANPFYDNIRQNLELSMGITERIPLIMPPHISSRAQELPFQWLRDIVRKASARSADGIIGGEALEDLAMQFYRIELGEQRRLNGVMEHHSKESTTRPGQLEVKPVAFPYSITAGVEKGTKNRHRNVWPFEHARVRLQHPVDNDGTGYINASYVQPRCTALKYIATQGPLAATFTDFWTLVWEQNVGIIVMLTKQVEGHSVKCHCYWKDEQFGPLRLQMLDVEGPTHLETDVIASGLAGASGTVGFDFGAATDIPASPAGSVPDHGSGIDDRDRGQEGNDERRIIRRTFMLSHAGHPSLPPRKIVQLQFLEWPDLNVPSSPRSLLRLVWELDTLRKEYRSLGGPDPIHPTQLHKGESQPGPVLIHCSAGVGRTGSFVIIDAVLNAIRREARMLASSSNARNRHEGDGTDQRAVAVAPNRNPTVTFGLMPSSQHVDSRDDDGDGDSDTGHHQASVVKLDSEGNEVVEPDARTVKKRKSSGGGGTNSGNSNALRPSTEASSSAASLVPPPPVPTLRINRGRLQSSGKPFELDPRKLQAKRSSAGGASGNGSGGGSHATNDSVDSFPSSFASRASDNMCTSVGGSSSTAPTSLSSSPHPSAAPVSSPMRMTASEAERQPKVRPVDLERGLPPLPSSASSFTPERAVKDRIATPSSPVSETFAVARSPSNARPISHPGIPNIISSINDQSAVPPSRPHPGQSLSVSLEESRPKAQHHPSASHTEEISTTNVSDEPVLDTSVTPSTSTPSEMALDDDVHPRKTAMAPPTSMRYAPQPTATNSVCDYAPPRRIYLSKEIKRTVKAAAGRAALTSAEQSIPQPPSHVPLQREMAVKPSSLPHSHVTSPPPHISLDQPSSSRQRDAKADLGNEDVRVLSSDESSPSSPDLLAEIEEPIRQVLEDMREQRMSLCQSLRQYVFVHLAILEGALSIVDQLSEEKAHKERNDLAPPHNELAVAVQSPPKDSMEKHLTVIASGFDNPGNHIASPPNAKQVVPISNSSSTKRLAMKRKKRSNDSESPRYEKMFID